MPRRPLPKSPLLVEAEDQKTSQERLDDIWSEVVEGIAAMPMPEVSVFRERMEFLDAQRRSHPVLQAILRNPNARGGLLSVMAGDVELSWFVAQNPSILLRVVIDGGFEEFWENLNRSVMSWFMDVVEEERERQLQAEVEKAKSEYRRVLFPFHTFLLYLVIAVYLPDRAQALKKQKLLGYVRVRDELASYFMAIQNEEEEYSEPPQVILTIAEWVEHLHQNRVQPRDEVAYRVRDMAEEMPAQESLQKLAKLWRAMKKAKLMRASVKDHPAFALVEGAS